ncbi:hypothetical protein PsorP6_000879 [Peronosclerospora sorghi]|uniref:Uncharacterized protein n=1 Tax=Peronosclerospora sorghi TaxID=230839 RepID=A0ACC0WUQ9_9STRA|nr:hypothetical protein PsorP6_000879 [Peronosclerospora sorghi]
MEQWVNSSSDFSKLRCNWQSLELQSSTPKILLLTISSGVFMWKLILSWLTAGSVGTFACKIQRFIYFGYLELQRLTPQLVVESIRKSRRPMNWARIDQSPRHLVIATPPSTDITKFSHRQCNMSLDSWVDHLTVCWVFDRAVHDRSHH